MFKHILVPFDFGDASLQALALAVDLAKVHGARLTILHVCEIPAYVYEGVGSTPVDLLTPISQAAEEHLKELVRDVQARFPGAEGLFQVGSVAESILGAIPRRACDLVVMGTHGRRGLVHAALGSVAEKIVRLSTVPVLTVHASAS
jgi:nucleotide-binding universal stress UspA family protein